MSTIMMRLGLVLSGTNEDLLAELPKQQKEAGAGEPDESETEESESDEDTGGEGESTEEDSEEEEEADEDAEGSGSEEADAEDDGESGEGSGSDDEEDAEDVDETEGEDSAGSEADAEEEEDADGGAEEEDELDEAAKEIADLIEKLEGEQEAEEEEGEELEGDSSETAEGDSPEGEGEEPSKGEEEPSESKDDGEADDGSEGGEAGGYHEPDEEPPSIAESLLAAMEAEVETGLLDNNQALSEAVNEEATDTTEVPLEQDEAIWRPYEPAKDVVKTVKPTDNSREAAARMRETVKDGVSYLRNKLRSKFLQARTPQTIHGVRHGRDLSERHLVNSYVELKSGRRPERPDWRKVEREECSLACAIVLDESASMANLVTAVGQAAMAVAEPLDKLGSPCLVIGPRNGGRDYSRDHAWGVTDQYDEDGKPRFHRTSSVIIDVFKGWEEDFNRAVDRFGRLQAVGSTPLEDGIQFALQELSDRPERHRVVLVITDGCPDNPAVVRRQIRLAAKSGVHVIGVGIDSGCYQVKQLFPEHVAVAKIGLLPAELLRILENIMFPKNGKRIALDGKFKTRSSVKE